MKLRRSPRRRGCSIGCGSTLVLLLACVVVVWLKERIDPGAQALIAEAGALYSEGRFDEAEEAYLGALALAPDNAAILERLGTIALWRNDLQQAEGRLEAALQNTPWYRSFWPLDVNLKYRLGVTYLRQDRFTELNQLYREARGPVAIGPFQFLDAFAEQMALFEGQTPYEIEGPDETRVDFIVTDPLPVVELSINGGEPICFIVDTGGMELVLDDDLAEEVGAQIAGSFTGSYGGQKEAATGLGRVDSVSIGDFIVRNVPVHTLDTDPWSSDLGGLEVRGVVSTRFLMHFLATIDYPGGALILRRTTAENLEALEAELASAQTKVIPFWLIETHYIVAWGTVNDIDPMLFFVDTGLAGGGFTASESVLEEAGIPVDWTQAEEEAGGGGAFLSVDIVVDRLTLGSGENEVVEIHVPGSASEAPPSILGDTLGFRIGGLISHEFFRGHALTLDFTGMRLILQ